MTWRIAKSLEMLRTQVNEKWPNRSKASDGTIGNAEHASRTSDHNPWVKDGLTGIVTGMDITHDPAHGLDSEALAEALRAARDPRIKYVISNRKIYSSTQSPWKWRPYTGANAHNHHVHISVKAAKASYDSTARWSLDGVAAPDPQKPAMTVRPSLHRGSTGDDVRELQAVLGVKVDGSFGAETEAAVKAKQKAARIVSDGIVGPYTWEVLTHREDHPL